MLQVYTDEEKRTVVAKITEYGKEFIGKAKCSPEDKFDPRIGRIIAVQRAKKKLLEFRYKTTVHILRYHKKEILELMNDINKITEGIHNCVEIITSCSD